MLLLVSPAFVEYAAVGEGGNPFAALLAGGGGGGGGGGGRDVAGYISLPAYVPPPAEPLEQIADPTETPDPPDVPTPTVEPDSLADTTAQLASADSMPGPPGEGGVGPGSGGGAGGGTGGGVGPGAGPGTGPGAGGAGARGVGPRQKQMIVPPLDDKPRDLVGRTVTVTFYVSRTGRVDRIEVDPEIRDRTYARKFRDAMVRYSFYPARSPAGEPIDAVYTVAVGL